MFELTPADNQLKMIHRISGEAHDGAVCWLGKGDVEDVLRLQEQVMRTLDSEDLYMPLSEEEAEAMLGPKGLAMGIRVDNRLIGFRVLYFPGDAKDNLGRDVGIPDSELHQVAHLEASAVLPEFRGNRVQSLLTSRLIQKLEYDGQYRYLLSTVSTQNIASMRDKFHARLAIVSLRQKYGGFWRYIFYRDLCKPKDLFSAPPAVKITVESDDTDRQLELLCSGWQGYATDGSSSGQIFVTFGHPSQSEGETANV